MPPRILIADDDEWILRMVKSVLNKPGYEVKSVTDGEAAHELAIREQPHLLITDVMMPKMDGWTLVRSLRSRPELAFMAVIFLSALSSDDDRIRGFRLGADDFLPKPFRFEELDLRVTKTLRARQHIEQQTRNGMTSSVADDGVTLAGNLAEVGLAPLLSLLELERKTGILELTRGHETGYVHIRDGCVLRATVDQRTGKEALFELLGWATGRFDLDASAVDGRDDFGEPTTALLLEAARRTDEGSRLARARPGA